MKGKTLFSRYVILSLYTLLIVCMGIATIVERQHGSAGAHASVYGTWWFAALWAVLALVSLAYLVRRGVLRRGAVALLHLSFAVILAGALLTRLTAESGTLHLRQEATATAFTGTDGAERRLPFAVSLCRFAIVCYPGTDAVMDYQADLRIAGPNGATDSITVAMNHIGRADGYRFYQSAYDDDLKGVVLLVAHDPYGIAVTYAGYLMLLAGLVWTLASRRTRIRSLYRRATAAAPLLLLAFLCPTDAAAQHTDGTIRKDLAREVAAIPVLYDGRICPLNTPATAFVTKLCGDDTWQGLSADEIFVGWMIHYHAWETKPIIKVAHREVQQMLGISGPWAAVTDFYTPQHAYKLEGKANDMTLDEGTRKAVREADEKIRLITMFYNSEMLRMFPLETDGQMVWHTPGSTALPQGVPEAEFQFINHAMDHLVMHLLAEDADGVRLMAAKIRLYQREKAGDAVPSTFTLRAETFYNRLAACRLAPRLCLVLGLVACVMALSAARRWRRWLMVIVAAMAAYLTLLIALRWWISGHVPLGNGYETMLFMAWTAIVLTLVLMRRFALLAAFGPMASALCLLVASMAMGSPQVSRLMPVLQSPLLTVHVAIIMMAYTLLAFTAFIAVCCLCTGSTHEARQRRLTALSQLTLYPAVACLAAGIFIGAVWANVSWGTYWSWDPKETWALITMMVYAVPLHRSPLTDNNHPKRYHTYVLLAFLTVIITYFGVNYLMPGMHSYA